MIFPSDGDPTTIAFVTGYFGLLVTTIVGSVIIAHRRFVSETKKDVTTGFDRAAHELDRLAAEKVGASRRATDT